MGIWFWFLIFDLVIGAILFLIFYGERKHAEYNPNTINYNPDMTEFWYFIPKAPKTVKDFLSRQSKRDTIYYSYAPDTNTILFYPELSNMPGAGFRLELTAVRGGTELRIFRHGEYPRQDMLALRQNDFWHKKLEALPIPYLTPEEMEDE